MYCFIPLLLQMFPLTTTRMHKRKPSQESKSKSKKVKPEPSITGRATKSSSRSQPWLTFDGAASEHVQAKGTDGGSFPCSMFHTDNADQIIKWLDKYKNYPYCKVTCQVHFYQERPLVSTSSSAYSQLYCHDVSTLETTPMCFCRICMHPVHEKDVAELKQRYEQAQLKTRNVLDGTTTTTTTTITSSDCHLKPLTTSLTSMDVDQKYTSSHLISLSFVGMAGQHIQTPDHSPDTWECMDHTYNMKTVKQVIGFLEVTKRYNTCVIQALLTLDGGKTVLKTNIYCRDPSTEQLVPACVCSVCNPKQNYRLSVTRYDAPWPGDVRVHHIRQPNVRPWCVGIYVPPCVVDGLKGQCIQKQDIKALTINGKSVLKDSLLLFNTQCNEIHVYLDDFKDTAIPLVLATQIRDFKTSVIIPKCGSLPLFLQGA